MARGRSGGPGSYTKNGVNCTMNAAFPKAASSRKGAPGRYGSSPGPFDKPQSMGNGGIPTKFFEDMPTRKVRTVNAGTVAPGVKGQPSVGTRRFRA